MEIEREEVSLAEMLKNLKKRVYAEKELSLLKFFEEMHSRREIVTAFFAILEIVRTEGIVLTQSTTFGDIILRKI
jgi:chromatin segregation and condensation protein Rec8/ScpA/Scc1 (kleisin family)